MITTQLCPRRKKEKKKYKIYFNKYLGVSLSCYFLNDSNVFKTHMTLGVEKKEKDEEEEKERSNNVKREREREKLEVHIFK